MFHKHLVIAFELLNGSLLDLLEEANFEGFSLSEISQFTRQILEGLIFVEEMKIIHCDLKPENILFIPNKINELKIIDFGSACHLQNRIYSYIQTRFYRAPEVLLSSKYNSSIDIWSLGCICAELYLGYPIFPGNSQYDQLSRIIDLLGQVCHLKNQLTKVRRKVYISKRTVKDNMSLRLKKNLKKLLKSTKEKLKPQPIFFSKLHQLEDLIFYYSESKFRQIQEKYDEIVNFPIFVDFLKGLINIDPKARWIASKAILHPFIQRGHNLGSQIDISLPFIFENQQQDRMGKPNNGKMQLQKAKINKNAMRETKSLKDNSDNIQQDFNLNTPYLNQNNTQLDYQQNMAQFQQQQVMNQQQMIGNQQMY